ncbi:MAG: hypothetical protein RMK52_03095 [Chitinophagales bacterium]|nr:hypothetical protein [Chitinophagales bacterium]MDW8393211.1 hypothetical protein [Chitinophagales bacterium]
MTLIFEFVTSLLLVFLLFSIIVSSLTEFYNSRIGKNSRAVLLYESLLRVFNDRHNRNFTDDLYRHPLIASSKYDSESLPAYLDGQVFADALVEVLVRHHRPIQISYTDEGKPVVAELPVYQDEVFSLFGDAVRELNSSDLKSLLQSFLHRSRNDGELKQAIVHWYDSYMDRVTGWYKRKVRKQLLWMSLFIVVALNADLFRIAASLWQDRELRAALRDQALAIGSDSLWLESMQQLSVAERRQMADSLYAVLLRQGLPVGWITRLDASHATSLEAAYPVQKQRTFFTSVSYRWKYFNKLVAVNAERYFNLTTILGWLLMAFAVHLGAPFWFQILNKFINIRGAGPRPGTS